VSDEKPVQFLVTQSSPQPDEPTLVIHTYEFTLDKICIINIHCNKMNNNDLPAPAGFHRPPLSLWFRLFGLPLPAATGELMTAEVDHSQDRDTCRKLISLGYARSNQVRLYGQEMKLVSDPFPTDGGIAIEVVAGDGSPSRRIKLPLSILQMAASKRVA